MQQIELGYGVKQEHAREEERVKGGHLPAGEADIPGLESSADEGEDSEQEKEAEGQWPL